MNKFEANWDFVVTSANLLHVLTLRHLLTLVTSWIGQSHKGHYLCGLVMHMSHKGFAFFLFLLFYVEHTSQVVMKHLLSNILHAVGLILITCIYSCVCISIKFCKSMVLL